MCPTTLKEKRQMKKKSHQHKLAWVQVPPFFFLYLFFFWKQKVMKEWNATLGSLSPIAQVGTVHDRLNKSPATRRADIGMPSNPRAPLRFQVQILSHQTSSAYEPSSSALSSVSSSSPRETPRHGTTANTQRLVWKKEARSRIAASIA